MARTPSLNTGRFPVWIVLFAVLLMTPGAHAQATIHVTTTTPGNTGGVSCSLQEAIYSAEFGQNIAIDQTDPDHNYTTACEPGTGSGDTIVLENKTYSFNAVWDGDAHNIFGPTATPIIFKTMTIQGNGATLKWTGTGNVRLFAVGYASLSFNANSGAVTSGTPTGSGNLTLQNVYVTGFHVKGGNGAGGGGGGLGAGGAIIVSGNFERPSSLTVENSTFENNGAVGGNGGGGLFGGGGGLNGNGGNSTYPAVGGGGGGGSHGDGGNGGPNGCASNDYRCETGGGGGGTVYSGGNGVFNNQTNVPGSGGYLNGGDGGGPGIIHNGYVTNVDGADGTPGGGGGGGGYNNYFLGGEGKGGNGGYGGGGGGGPAGGGTGGFGGGGGGGACDCGSGGGTGGFGGGGGMGASGGLFGGHGATGDSDGGGGGGGALGGVIFNEGATILIQNSTFTKNYVSRGASSGGNSANGGDSGGAIFSLNGTLTVQNSTISGNEATGAGGGVVVYSTDGASSRFFLQNTIIANNDAQECIVEGPGSFYTYGSAANLIVNNSGCPNVTVTSDPQLDSLKLNNPGNTPTMAITADSAAFDTADDNTALGTDQRGVSRPQSVHSDIGAFELVLAADLSITKSVSSSTAQPGDTLTYTIVVKNAGPQPASGVTVSDTFPSSLGYLSCSATNGGACSFTGSAVNVNYTTLAVGEVETITIQGALGTSAQDGLVVSNTANVSASSPIDPNTGDNSASASFTVHNRADLAVTKTVTTSSPYSPKVEAGDSMTYTVTLTNKGPYDARAVVLSDSAPSGVTFTGCTSSVGSCVWSSSSASLTLANFSNASIATLTIQGTLSFKVADQALITNTASVASTTFDPDTTNNSASASFSALNNSDLFVTQSNTKLASRQLQYSVSVKNLGLYLAKQLVLNDAVPSGSTFVSIAPGPWTCTAPAVGASGTISCKLASEAAGATQSINFVVKVKTPGNVLVSNTASISEATHDPNAGNNTSNVSTKVGP